MMQDVDHRDVDATRNVDPISKLHEDLLWKIFMLNSDIKGKIWRIYESDNLSDWKDRPLIVTWSCSHVCRRWRGLILNSPSLWGRLIDLDALANIKPTWKDEIMRRTGQSVLIVQGSIFAQKPQERDFFLSTLREYWRRLQTLNARISRGKTIPDHTWNLLFRPAPALRKFCLRSTDGFNYPSLSSSGFGVLFANQAPLIEEFTAWKLNFTLNLEIQWISHIRRLNVSYVTSMSITDWLGALEHMPRIEYLSLTKALPIPPDGKTSVLLRLPSLGEIVLINRLRACAVFLAQIVPQIGCYLSMQTTDDEESLPSFDSDLRSASQVLPRYSQNFFNKRVVTTLKFSVCHTGILVQDRPQHLHQDARNFHVDVYGTTPEQLPIILPPLGAFSSCNFDKITTLEFQADLFSFQQTLDSSVHDFLLSLQSVETLLTFREGLSSLHLWEDALAAEPTENDHLRQPILPKLHTVKVRPGGTDEIEVLHLEWALKFLSFLASRRESRAPIKVLDLTGWKYLHKVNVFDGMTDLKVIYRDEQGTQEYICGRGLQENST